MGIGQVQSSCGCQGKSGTNSYPVGQLQELMKNLSSEDRVELQNTMQELSQGAKQIVMQEFKNIDSNILNSDNLFDNLMSIISNTQNEDNSFNNSEMYA